MFLRNLLEKMNRSGKSNSCVTNIAEPHGDVQPSTTLTGQMPGKEDRMSDYGRGLKAKVPLDDNAGSSQKGYLVTTTDQGVFMDAEVLEKSFDLTPEDRSVLQYWKVEAPPEVQRKVNTLKHILEGMVEGVGRDCALNLFPHGDMYVFIVRMLDVQHQTKPITIAGSPGSCVLFIDPRAVPESRAPANWIRLRIQEHLAVTPQTLVVLIPSELIEFLIALALSKRGRQRIRQQYWKSIRARRKNMSEKCRRELQECTSGTEVVVGEEFDWDYKQKYISGVQSVVAAVAHTGLSPFEICSLVRKGQRSPKEAFCPDYGKSPDCSDCAVGDGADACWFARLECGMGDKELHKTFEQFPKTFTKLGWERVAVPSEDAE